LTDLHISKYRDPSRVTDLKKFTQEILPLIKPKLLIVSGDLTDSRGSAPLAHNPNKEEWISYSEILSENQNNTKTIWLDLRGNHGNFISYTL
jgi:hypothetical protein